jgi:hypothetical protein
MAEGRFAHRASCLFRRRKTGEVSGFSALEQDFDRVEADAVPGVPAQWKKFLGSYGPEFIPLIVSIKHGHLYAMTENMVDYRLWPLNRTVCRMPKGMYVDEQLVFQTDQNGHVHSVTLANMTLPRRSQPASRHDR